MIIKNATTTDFSKIATIYNEHIRRNNATMEEKIHEEKDIADWIKNFNNRERLFVAKIEGKVIGWGIIKKYSNRNGYRFAAETAVYFSSSHLRKGYGSRMKKHLIEQAKLLKYNHLVAKIFADNKTSIRYNLKLGYELVGIQKNIGYKNGKWQDVAILQYLLD